MNEVVFTFVLGSGVASPRRTLSRPGQLTDLTFLSPSVELCFKRCKKASCFDPIKKKIVQIFKLPFERLSCSCVSVNLWKWANVRESLFGRGGEGSRWEG